MITPLKQNFFHSIEICKKKAEVFYTQIEFLRLNMEAYQRIGQVTIAILEAFGLYYQTTVFPKLIKVLKVVNSHDFYDFFQIPHKLLYPLDANSIDEWAFLEKFHRLLASKIDLNESKKEPLKDILESFISYIAQRNYGYKNQTEFQEGLKKWLLKHPRFQTDFKIQNLSEIDFTHLEISVKKISIIERISRAFFYLSFMVCVPCYLIEWKLLNLSYIINKIGLKKLTFLTEAFFNQVLTGSLVLAFLTQSTNEIMKLRYKKLTAHERKRTLWTTTVSTAESLFNLSVFIQCSQATIIFTTFVAKSLGLLSIILKQDPNFFENNTKIPCN